jgi:hypothetical protein
MGIISPPPLQGRGQGWGSGGWGSMPRAALYVLLDESFQRADARTHPRPSLGREG